MLTPNFSEGSNKHENKKLRLLNNNRQFIDFEYTDFNETLIDLMINDTNPKSKIN